MFQVQCQTAHDQYSDLGRVSPGRSCCSPERDGITANGACRGRGPHAFGGPVHPGGRPAGPAPTTIRSLPAGRKQCRKGIMIMPSSDPCGTAWPAPGVGLSSHHDPEGTQNDLGGIRGHLPDARRPLALVCVDAPSGSHRSVRSPPAHIQDVPSRSSPRYRCPLLAANLVLDAPKPANGRGGKAQHRQGEGALSETRRVRPSACSVLGQSS